MKNYFNFKKLDNQFLLTNDFGRFAFLNEQDFYRFLNNQLNPESEAYVRLRDGGFIFDESLPMILEKGSEMFRDSKNYLFSATNLHIFVVTTACNMNCIYCQASSGTFAHGVMDISTAKHAVDIALQSPAPHLVFEFQGGEPLLNFDVVKFITTYALENKGSHEIDFTIVTNLTLLSPAIIDFFSEYGFIVSTSLDGNELLHNSNRPYANGTATFRRVCEGIQTLHNAGVSVGALLTTTKLSMKYAKEIVQTYVDLGLSSIALRPLTRLGRASEIWDKIGYSADEFVDFYKRTFEEILNQNKDGYYIQESIASILCSKILHHYPTNYMELRSPCGAAIGQLAYYTDGNVFTCDEGRMLFEMGQDDFCLGNVFTDSYDTIMNSSRCKITCASSILESLPKCCDCVYQPFCGTCPVVHYATNNNVLSTTANDFRCKINSGILDEIFRYLRDDADAVSIITNWTF